MSQSSQEHSDYEEGIYGEVEQIIDLITKEHDGEWCELQSKATDMVAEWRMRLNHIGHQVDMFLRQAVFETGRKLPKNLESLARELPYRYGNGLSDEAPSVTDFERGLGGTNRWHLLLYFRRPEND